MKKMKNYWEVLPLFSSPLAYTMVEEDTDELNDYEVVVTSNYDDVSYRSTNTNFNDRKRVLEKYPHIRDILIRKFKQYSKNILHINNDYRITTSWITNVDKGGSAVLHNHKNSFYSGIYYFQDDYPENSAEIEFTSPIVQLSDFLIEPEECDITNGNSYTLSPKSNLLLLFPSYLKHRVLIHTIDKQRRSLAFNIVPTGLYGKGDSTYDTNWFK